MEPQVEAVGEAALARLGPTARVLGGVDGCRREPGELGAGVTPAYDEARAELSQRLVEVGERLGEKTTAVGGPAEWCLEDRRVEDEERYHLGRLPGCRGERRVVVHPQVAREEDDGSVQGLSMVEAGFGVGQSR